MTGQPQPMASTAADGHALHGFGPPGSRGVGRHHMNLKGVGKAPAQIMRKPRLPVPRPPWKGGGQDHQAWWIGRSVSVSCCHGVLCPGFDGIPTVGAVREPPLRSCSPPQEDSIVPIGASRHGCRPGKVLAKTALQCLGRGSVTTKRRSATMCRRKVHSVRGRVLE